jgi:diguanylate cyclase (GGDEF)-like protein/PAS domain S-box-containing protein
MSSALPTASSFDEPNSSELGSGLMMNLALGQSQILELIATDAPLAEAMTALLIFLERDTPDMLCSVLLLDADGVHLRHCAAPSLPPEYTDLINGAAIGPRAGSCGTAAYRGERVIVHDIETDPLWEDFREFARPFGLRACWSTPILDPSSRVLGTFAMYFRRPLSPTLLHERLTETALHVAAIAMNKERREKERQEDEERYRLINLATNDAVWDWNLRTGELWWNDSVEVLFGYPAHEVTNQLDWWTERVHPEDRDRVIHSLEAAADSGQSSWFEEYRFLRKDGSFADVQDRGYVMRDARGASVRMIGSMQDITERKRTESKIRELAFREPVTGLPNRAALKLRLHDAIERAKRGRHGLALVLANLNFFRDINECLGHQNGDAFLTHVGERFRAALGLAGEVAALGGDEYAILLPRVHDASEVEAALAAIHESLEIPVRLAEIPIKIDTTLGAALYPEHGTSVELLWQHADVALRTAKEKFASHLFYGPEIDHYDPQRLLLIGELHDAIEARQLLLHYQPKIDLKTGRTIGLEALVRWQHPGRGLIFPDTFIPLAERTGLINPLTTAVVVAALEQGVALRALGLTLGVSVNLSARNLHEPRFSSKLLGLVSSIGFPLSELTLEVTETAIMADPVRAKAVLSELREAGIHLSMDDFGIGQSSLSYLKELPISKMKIDKSFVMDFEQPRNVAVVRSAIDMGRNMGLQVTAEGIEHEATYHALREFGCHLGQGYFFSRPLAIDKLLPWLGESRFGAGQRETQ